MTISLISIMLLTPIVATLAYSLSTSWVKTILPTGLTFHWYVVLTSSPSFLPAVLRSFGVGVATVIVSMVIFLPVIFYINVYEPKLKAKMRFLTIIPFTIPGIVLVTGLVQLYANLPIPKIVVLILTLTAINLPSFYQSLNNVFMGRDFRAMFEQAQLLGESPVGAFMHVILPNIRSGVLVGMLLTFTGAFSEYVVTNIFLGGEFETLKIYMYRLMSVNGNAGSVLTIIYFGFLMIISFLLIKTVHGKKIDQRKE
nr:ABC transporter permease subunit [Liquorilactobacillus satsumensis]